MKKTLFIIISIGVLVYIWINKEPAFVVPPLAEKSRSSSGIKTYEFNALFEQKRTFKKLAKDGYYTVIEGYINTCSICKRLESGFKPFLAKRKDVLIRRVHFNEGGSSQKFSADTKEEYERQVGDFFERMSMYNFTHIIKTTSDYKFSTCGTPHIEIYGPDRQLIATDLCSENLKSGLNYLRSWMRAESS